MLKHIKKGIGFLDQIAFGISAVSLVVVAVAAVFWRFVLNKPIVWAEEVQMILVVWSVFFGASIAIREKGHIAVDIVYDALKSGAKKFFSVLIWIIIAVSIGAITKLEIDRVVGQLQSGIRTSVLHINSAVEYIGVVAACVLMLINHIIVGIEAITRKEDTPE